MGCDIHVVMQYKKDDKWIDIEEFNEDRITSRSYAIFAWLANVRNSHGIQPIDEPRGLPKDFEIKDDYHEHTWMGDHSHSWLTFEEIMQAHVPHTPYTNFEWFLIEIKCLYHKYGNGRMVFGFDS